MRFAAKTDIGKRAKNEDNFRIPGNSQERNPLFVVSDGMGGHAAGAIASGLIVQSIDRICAEANEDGASFALDSVDTLKMLIATANNAVYDASLADDSLSGMGATLVCALFLDETHFLAGNVGDSRLYHYEAQSGLLSTVTIDHSLVEQLVLDGIITKEQAKHHPQRNIITRAMGVSSRVNADVFEHAWQTGDFLVLCSDGLHGALENEALISVLEADSSLEEKCDALVQMALDNGGTDNITVVIIANEGGLSEC